MIVNFEPRYEYKQEYLLAENQYELLQIWILCYILFIVRIFFTTKFTTK